MSKKPSVTIETITPQIASQWIERIHPKNRKSRSNRINLYAADMKAGKWYLSNDAIVWDDRGYIINAANRLHAVVVSGVPCQFMVLRNAEEESKIIMDTGMKRSTDDNFMMAGRDYVRGCGATVRRALYGYTQLAKFAITDQEVAEFMDNNGEAIDFAHQNLPKGQVARAYSRAVVARAYLKRHPQYKLQRFCEVLISGISLSKEESIIVRLRNFLIEDKDVRASSKRPRDLYGKTARALWAYLNDEELQRLETPSEELFPIRSIDNIGEPDEETAA